MPRAFITGITGQDGSYLAELLLDKGYEVHGLVRRDSPSRFEKISHLCNDPDIMNKRLFLHYGDLCDSLALLRLINIIQPDEVYNLGAQSHVRVSFDVPEQTCNTVGMAVLRLLEAIMKSGQKPRFYQASSSEMFGKVMETPQSERTPFYPRSPYGVAKVFGYWMTINYRESYGLHASNGILFNHESPRRGETFVTRKITRGLANIAQGLEQCLYMGNLNSLRDWGHAKDYVRMQWLMLQQDKPVDYVIATGQQHSVRDFILWSAAELGIGLRFEGEGDQERAVVDSITGDLAPALKQGDRIVSVDPRYYRPAEVETLLGDASKAREALGWVPEVSVREMCAEMIANDLEAAKRLSLLRRHGHDVTVAREAGQ